MQTHSNTWTEEIKSDNSLWSVNYKEIWHYRDLLLMLVKRNFTNFYKQTILGPIWFFIQPILTTFIYVILFGQVAKLSTDGLPHIPFYLAGITIWNYFAECLTKNATVFKDNAGVFGKVYFPRLIMPLTIVVSGLLRFVVQFALFIAVVIYYTFVEKTIHPNLWILMTPILMLLMAGFAMGLGMIFSSLTTKYKDLVFLLNFGIQLFMYVTPVIYSMTSLDSKYKLFVEANPLSSIFECFRYAYLGSGSFEPATLINSTLIIGFLLFIGILVFNKVEKSFMDTV